MSGIFHILSLVLIWLSIPCESSQTKISVTRSHPEDVPVLNVTLSAQVSYISDLQCQKEIVCRVNADRGTHQRILDISILEMTTNTVLRRVSSVYYLTSRNFKLNPADTVDIRSGIRRENSSLVVRSVLPINTGFGGEEFVCKIAYVDWNLQVKSMESDRATNIQDRMCKVPDVLQKLDSMEMKFNRMSTVEANGNFCSPIANIVSTVANMESKLENLADRGNKLEIIHQKMSHLSDLSNRFGFLEKKLLSKSDVEKGGDADRDKVCTQSDVNKKLDAIQWALRSISEVQSKLDFFESMMSNHSEISHKLDTLESNFNEKLNTLEVKMNYLSDVTLNLTELVSAKVPEESGEVSSCETLRDHDQGHGLPSRRIITWPNGIKVLCDTETDGGGWTVFQRRFNRLVSFKRVWKEYEEGFGDIEGEFWMGLKHLQRLVKTGEYEMRVDMRIYNGSAFYAYYSHFTLSHPVSNYKLSLRGFSGDVERDGMSESNGRPFSTSDRDNDNWSLNCAKGRGGGWWYDSCSTGDLNMLWRTTDPQGIYWLNVTPGYHRVVSSEMKVRKRK